MPGKSHPAAKLQAKPPLTPARSFRDEDLSAKIPGQGLTYHAGGRVPQSPMVGLTPASADDLLPLGELLVDDPFWQYPAWGLAREGAGHLRVWVTATASAGYLAVVTETGGITSVTESAGRIWAAAWLADTGPPSCCSSTTPRRSPARAWRPSTWSASALTGARTGPASGRPRRRTRVTPGWNSGWPLTGTRSSAGPRAGSIGVTAITTDCSWRLATWFAPGAPEAASVPRARDGRGALWRSASVPAGRRHPHRTPAQKDRGPVPQDRDQVLTSRGACPVGARRPTGAGPALAPGSWPATR